MMVARASQRSGKEPFNVEIVRRSEHGGDMPMRIGAQDGHQITDTLDGKTTFEDNSKTFDDVRGRMEGFATVSFPVLFPSRHDFLSKIAGLFA